VRAAPATAASSERTRMIVAGLLACMSPPTRRERVAAPIRRLRWFLGANATATSGGPQPIPLRASGGAPLRFAVAGFVFLSDVPPQVSLKLEAVLEQRQIGDECRRPYRFDLRDDRREVVRGERLVERAREVVEAGHHRRARHAGRG